MTLDKNGQESNRGPPITLSRNFLVHRLIAATFLRAPTLSMYPAGALIEVHHLAPCGDKSKNEPRYITWLSNVQNTMENFIVTLHPDIY